MKENAFSSPPTLETFSDQKVLRQGGQKKNKKQVNETNIVKIYFYMHQVFDV